MWGSVNPSDASSTSFSFLFGFGAPFEEQRSIWNDCYNCALGGTACERGHNGCVAKVPDVEAGISPSPSHRPSGSIRSYSDRLRRPWLHMVRVQPQSHPDPVDRYRWMFDGHGIPLALPRPQPAAAVERVYQFAFYCPAVELLAQLLLAFPALVFLHWVKILAH